jgi:hypothetical protein
MSGKKHHSKHTLCPLRQGVLSKIIEMKKRDVQQTHRFQKASLALGYYASNVACNGVSALKEIDTSVGGISGDGESLGAPPGDGDGPPAIIYITT